MIMTVLPENVLRVLKEKSSGWWISWKLSITAFASLTGVFFALMMDELP